jgi:hypothetical protein
LSISAEGLIAFEAVVSGQYFAKDALVASGQAGCFAFVCGHISYCVALAFLSGLVASI